MIPDKVIVTIYTMEHKLLGDFELPTKVPVKNIKLALLDAISPGVMALDAESMGFFLCENQQFGHRIPDEDTLADHGVCDGCAMLLTPHAG